MSLGEEEHTHDCSTALVTHTHIHTNLQRSVLNPFIITSGGLSPVHCTFSATLSWHTHTHTRALLPVSLNRCTVHIISLYLSNQLHFPGSAIFLLGCMYRSCWIEHKDPHLHTNIFNGKKKETIKKTNNPCSNSDYDYSIILAQCLIITLTESFYF